MPTDEPREALRRRLVEAATAAVEVGGPEALQARKVAAEAGTSTQAIYTNFGGMPGLLEAVLAEAVTRFADHVRRVPDGDDPVADHLAKGFAYSEWALSHPQLYRLFLGPSPGGVPWDPGIDLGPGGAVSDRAEARAAFGVLLSSVTRVVESGRVRPVAPALLAAQFLSVTHGWVLLEMAHVFGEAGGLDVVEPLVVNLLVGLGDRRRSVERSWARALEIVATLPP